MGNKNARSHVARRWKGINSALTIGALILLLFSVISSPELYLRGPMMLASAVSASATVPPNPYNTLAEELAQKEALLNARERTEDARISAALTETTYAMYSFAMSLALFFMLGMNFYFDIRREKKGSRERALVA